MDGTLTTAAVGAALVGVASAFAPLLIARIPEPDPEPEPPLEAVDEAGEESGEDGTAVTVEEPKVPYAEIAARPGLWWRTALLGAASGALVGWVLGWSWSLVVFLPVLPLLVALAVVDWNTRLLPTWVIKPTYVLTLVLVVVAGIASGDLASVGRALLAWLAVGAFHFLLWFIHSAGLGYGDVRLSGVIGLLLGHLGWAEVLSGVWASFLVGGVVGGLLSLLGVVDRRGVPFGPFMVVGTLLGVLAGPWVSARLG